MARRTFTDNGYPCEPANISDRLWTYADRKGLCVVMRRDGKGIELDFVPWRVVKQAIADHEKAPTRKRQPPSTNKEDGK